MKKLLLSLSLLFSSFASASPSEADLINYAKNLMHEKNDISTIELNSMYGREKLLIMPISGFIWADVIRQLPQQFLYNLTAAYKTRNSAADLIDKINSRYSASSYEESNSLVTRTDNDYTFCIVDDGLRQEFEKRDGVLKPFFAGILPLYFQRDDLFDFVRHHESSHCLDGEFDGYSDEQRLLSTMINESKADLTASLVYANKNGSYDLFYKLIKPMRMVSVFDMEHTTEDAVEYLLRQTDPNKLRGLPFSQILEVRERLVAQLDTSILIEILIKNAYEKEQIGLYLVEQIRQAKQPVSQDMESLLSQNQQTLKKLITANVVSGSDLDRRYNSMVQSVIENNLYYKQYIDKSDPLIRLLPEHLESFGVNLNGKTQALLDALRRG